MPPAPLPAAGHPALDWINTGRGLSGRASEALPDATALLAWMVQASLLDEAQARETAQRFDADVLARVAVHARSLRQWFRTVLADLPRRSGPLLEAAEVARLNALLADDARYATLVPEGTGLALRPQRRLQRPGQLLCPLAEAIVDLLVHVERSRIRRCANPACPLWFVDRSRSGARRFCSAQRCGNRAKVAAYRARRRGAAA